MPAVEDKLEEHATVGEVYLCRITNPSPRARVIYDGIKSDKAIHIPPGKTVEAVLSDRRIGELQAEEMLTPEDPDLKVVELGPAPPPAQPPQAAARRVRHAGGAAQARA